VKKGVLLVELVYGPLARERQREHCPHGSWLHNRTECLTKIHTRPLGETLKNPAGLISLKRPVCGELVLEDPLSRHHVSL
jgi:hypothetical protein